MADAQTTPMMQQYHRMKRSLPSDVILLFRLGDFYEMFLDDAKEAAGILNVALTKRGGMPMCGVPYHSAEGYVAKLINAGKRVAIAEQTTEPKPGKLVEREIAHIITAGTISDLNQLESKRPNYLAAVHQGKKLLGLAYVDLTTGDFRLTECDGLEALRDELERVQPSELLFSDEQQAAFGKWPRAAGYDGYAFLHEQAYHLLKEHLKVQSLDGFGCAGLTSAVCAAGAVLHYLQFQLRRRTDHVLRLQPYAGERHVLIDAASQRHLELLQARSGPQHTLLAALDRTATPMGGRKLRHWLAHPLRDLAALRARQDVIEALVREPFVLAQVQECLRGVRDVERTLGRLSQGSGNARDLRALAKSLLVIPRVMEHARAINPDGSLPLPPLRAFPEVASLIDEAIVEEPPATIKEGGLFQDGYHADLDEIRAASREGKNWLADLQTREIERTGIKSLKVRFNAVFGYFIEITKSNLSQVPEDYRRKQTTANGERFITPELKEMENKILGAEERARAFEMEEFGRLRERVLEHLRPMQELADSISTLDALCGLAETARLFNYCRPLLNESLNLYIKDGRHPVLDQNLAEEKFVPNDVLLEPEENRLLLITGPNMAGKSTYLRQVALLTLMAHVGSFIPASQAEIGLVDRIFTRVGASDDLARGQSTFMVEMNETALIVNNATERSLVILDEIGRGTSTFDGLSIAWSVAEHLHDHVRARCLFATHYHEMTALAKGRPAVKNLNVAVREWNESIIFLRKIVPGAADRSYGIHVARLAGLPKDLLKRAQEILDHLEANASQPDRQSRKPERKTPAAEDVKPEAASPQLLLFG